MRAVVSGIVCFALCLYSALAMAEQAALDLPAKGTLIHWPEAIDQGNGQLGLAERGTLYVPADRASADSGTLALSYWRFRKVGPPAAERAPIFMLEGGPGFLGYNRNAAGYYIDYVRPYLNIADVVIVGQRGIGAAYPATDCPPPKGTSNTPLDPRYGPAAAQASRDCQAFWRAAGVPIEGLTVPAAAADVDDLRKALGYDQIVLMAESFGTHWAIAVMRQYPASVARAVLDSVEGPDHTYDAPSGRFRVLERIAADAEASDAFKGSVPVGGFIEALKRTIGAAEAAPIRFEMDNDAVTLTAAGLRTLSEGYLAPPRGSSWPAVWPLGILQWSRGDFTATAEALAGPYRFADFWHSVSFFQFDCGSGISPERDRALLNDPALAFIDDPNALYRHACPEWDMDYGADFRGRFSSTVPTLIVHGDWDLSTPWENALELIDQFEQGQLVRVRRGEHGTLRNAMEQDDEFAQAVMRFLSGEETQFPSEIVLPPPSWVTSLDVD
ncbi:MAG: alpha/beta hydrolase [Pseudomonadota bacterium]